MSNARSRRWRGAQALWLIAFVLLIAIASEIFRFLLSQTTVRDRYLAHPTSVWASLLAVTHIVPCLLLFARAYTKRSSGVVGASVFVGLGMLVWIAVDYLGILSIVSTGYISPNVPYLFWFAQAALLTAVSVGTAWRWGRSG